MKIEYTIEVEWPEFGETWPRKTHAELLDYVKDAIENYHTEMGLQIFRRFAGDPEVTITKEKEIE